jgi:hypothetical protein
MPQSQRKEAPILDELFGLSMEAPFWMGPVIATVVFAAARWGVPWALSVAQGAC